jgi:hypothetical protein
MAGDKVNWTFWVDQIREGLCTPLIADAVSRDFIFGEQDVVGDWAEQIGYPLTNRHNLAHIAHYLSIIENDQVAAKRSYLRHLIQSARKAAGPDEPVGPLKPPPGAGPGEGNSFSEVVSLLGLANFTRQPDNPFFILANLPILVYLTTGYHQLLEQALESVGRAPVCDYYRWNDDLDQQAKEEQSAYSHQPTVEQPLVYHLHGVDNEPESLVITEENYLEFHERASADINRQDGFPVPVRNALTKNSIMLLGYDLQSWAFRVIFRGPIRALFTLRRPLSLAIQMEPGNVADVTDLEQLRAYVRSYFDEYRFNLYWGNAADFTSELWQQWENLQ